MSKKAWIQTYNGHEVDLLNPRVEDVDAVDIAHSLSLINRFTGHTNVALSVAQHSVVGSILAEVVYPTVKWLPHAFLFHDATEAYVGDVSSPLKSLLSNYREIEDKHRKVIEMAFAVGLGGQWEKIVDLRMLITERQLWMPEAKTMWNEESEPFTLAEFTKGIPVRNVPETETEHFWNWLWSPWTAEQAEDRFHTRMETLDL